MTAIDCHVFRETLAETIKRVRYENKPIEIMLRGQVVCKLMPSENAKPIPPEFLKEFRERGVML